MSEQIIVERTIQVKGLELALKSYNENSGSIPVLALHGWLDNAASFDNLAPLLHMGIQLFSFDLPGHGRSSHRVKGTDYYIWSYAEDIINLADTLGFKTFSLLGHSMGGAVACLISSLCPERVQKMALLDAMGPTTTSPARTLEQMRRALEQKRKGKAQHYYSSFAKAVEARSNNGLTLHSAELLGRRGIKENEQGFYWANDQRLTQANPMSMTEEQVNEFFKEICCPTRIIASRQTWEDKREKYRERFTSLSTQANVDLFTLAGNHHQHLEGQVEEVAALLNEFFI